MTESSGIVYNHTVLFVKDIEFETKTRENARRSVHQTGGCVSSSWRHLFYRLHATTRKSPLSDAILRWVTPFQSTIPLALHFTVELCRAVNTGLAQVALRFRWTRCVPSSQPSATHWMKKLSNLLSESAHRWSTNLFTCFTGQQSTRLLLSLRWKSLNDRLSSNSRRERNEKKEPERNTRELRDFIVKAIELQLPSWLCTNC